MQITDITWPTVISVIAVIICLFTVFNTFSSTRKNYREIQHEKSAPIDKINQMLATDKLRLDNHEAMIHSLEKDAQDTRKGLTAIGQGVQALLQKDEGKVKSANDAMNDWLWQGKD